MLEENAEAVARVSKTFGLNGELTLNLYDSFPQDFNPSEPLFVVIDKLAVPLFATVSSGAAVVERWSPSGTSIPNGARQN